MASKTRPSFLPLAGESKNEGKDLINDIHQHNREMLTLEAVFDNIVT